MAETRTIDYGRHQLKHQWPADCLIQGGSAGLVVSPKNTYRTAFVEAFPRDPDTFIRGEGATIADAEDAAWARFQKYQACPHSSGYDRRGYINGAGFCKSCGMFRSDVFDLVEIGSVCCVCGAPYWTQVAGEMYCQEHTPNARPDGFIAGLMWELDKAADGETGEPAQEGEGHA